MKKIMFTLLASAVSLSAALAQTIVNTGFTSPYTDGDLAGQESWIAATNTGANAFDVTDAAGSGFADTVPTTLNTNSGNFVYLDTTSSGNAAGDEWDGVMVFTLSAPTPGIGGGDLLRIGLSSSAGSDLGQGNDGELPLRINVAGGGGVSINSADAAGNALEMLSVDAATLGWDPNAADLVTDQWRLSWKMRKTTDSDTFSMTCSMENLDNPTNLTGSGVSMVKTEAYASPGLNTVMGRSKFAEYNGTDSLNITIDDLSLVKSGAQPPRLYPTPVAVDAGNAFVNLSWDEVAEADSYDVKRADTIDGTYSVVTGGSGITTNGFSDTTVINGNLYYYKITSINGAVTADSEPVLADPDAAVTGTILDTTFDAADGYTDGDLDGQNSWKALTASAPKAFNVDSTGVGYAETATFSSDFDNETGNQVFYNKIMTNNVNAQWNGSVLFTLKTSPLPGDTAATLPAGQLLDLGISSDTDTILAPNDDDDALITLRGAANGDIALHLNGQNGNIHKLLTVTREELGWDPESGTAPDFETDPITLNWVLRKTDISNTYMGTVDITVGTNVLAGLIQFTDASESSVQPVDLYAADVARFGMSHSYQSQSAGNSMVNLSIDAISLTHTNSGEMLKAAPYDLLGAVGNLEVTVNWVGAIEADSYDVYRSDDSGATYSLVGNTTANSYTDTGLNDLYTYFYVVKAKYTGGDSDASEELIVRALGINPVAGMEWGSRDDIVTTTTDFPISSVDSNGVTTSVGSGADGALGSGTLMPASAVNAPAFYGVAQATDIWKRAGLFDNQNDGVDQIEFNADNNISALLYLEVPTGTVDISTGAYSLELENNSNQAGDWHAAIHDSVSGNWYVGDTEFTDKDPVNMGALNLQSWRLLDVASLTENNTALMTFDTHPITSPNLTAVDAIGIFADQAGRIRLKRIALNFGSSPSVYDMWTDSYGIYNDAAAGTNDYDHDGRNNVWEWGFDGNPILPNIQGVDDYDDVQVVGTNLVYIYPRLKDANARPDYFLTETDNLQYTGFTDQEVNYTITSGGTWTNQPNLEIVTNSIPTTDALKFIKLNIE